VNPRNAEAYNNLGAVHLVQGQIDKAIDELTEAVTLDPKYDNAYSNRGAAYQAKGSYDKAASDYRKALELNRHIIIWRAFLP
jgi:Tfp pilus assembly protein PilF